MKIVKMKGGLGNQLFQYAFALLLARESGEEVKLDMSTYQDLLEDPVRQPRILKFKTSLGLASRDEIRKICLFKHEGNMLSTSYKIKIAAEAVLNPKYFFERDRRHRDVSTIMQHKYFDGYWQSWRNVDAIWDECKTQLTPKSALHEETQAMIAKVSAQNSVFVGVRRGDYQSRAAHYGGFSQEYYSEAISIIKQRVQDPVFYVFSNDMDWVKKSLDFQGETVIYREQEDIIDDFDELLIMSKCKHAIIINSTYHWWGARLEDHEGKVVVAPKNWFFDQKPIDIVPNGWIRI